MTDQSATSNVSSLPNKEFQWIVLGLIMTAFRVSTLLIFLLYPLIVILELEGATCANFLVYHLAPYVVFYILTTVGCIANFLFMMNRVQTTFPRSKQEAYKFHRCFYRFLVVAQILILTIFEVGCLDKSGLAQCMALVLMTCILVDICIYGMIETQQVPLSQVVYYSN